MGVAITSSYEDVEKLIYQTVWRYQRIHGGDFQELLSDAHLHWVPAHGTFDPDRSRWSTYTSYKVWRGMQEELRTRLRKNHRLIYCQEQDLCLLSSKYTEKPLFDLSEDAKTITDLIENVDASVEKMVVLGIPGAEAKEACKAINPNDNNFDIIHEITSKLLGWQGLRFVNAMQEIKRKLGGEEVNGERKKRQEVIEMLAPFARGWPLPMAENLTPREAKIFDALMDLGCLVRASTKEHYLITNVGHAMLACCREENLKRD